MKNKTKNSREVKLNLKRERERKMKLFAPKSTAEKWQNEGSKEEPMDKGKKRAGQHRQS